MCTTVHTIAFFFLMSQAEKEVKDDDIAVCTCTEEAQSSRSEVSSAQDGIEALGNAQNRSIPSPRSSVPKRGLRLYMYVLGEQLSQPGALPPTHPPHTHTHTHVRVPKWEAYRVYIVNRFQIS